MQNHRPSHQNQIKDVKFDLTLLKASSSDEQNDSERVEINNTPSLNYFQKDQESVEVIDHLYIIFNFVENVEPAPGFSTFQEGHNHVASVQRVHEQFICGLLLEDVEPKSKNSCVTDKFNRLS